MIIKVQNWEELSAYLAENKPLDIVDVQMDCPARRLFSVGMQTADPKWIKELFGPIKQCNKIGTQAIRFERGLLVKGCWYTLVFY